jgi:hypothetical protein
MSDFREYFDPPGEYGHEWKVRWQRVAQDHPHLLESGSQPRPALAHPALPLDGMKKALQDELRLRTIVSEWATIQELSDFALPYGATRDQSQSVLCHHKLPRT